MGIRTTFIKAETQDYVLLNGSFAQANELATEAYSRIVCPLGTYMFDLNFGSYIPSWINSRRKLTAQIIINEVSRALQPLITENRAKSVEIIVEAILLNSFSAKINVTDMDNKTWSLPINYLNY